MKSFKVTFTHFAKDFSTAIFSTNENNNGSPSHGNEEGFVMVDICDLGKAMMFSSGTTYSSDEDRNADLKCLDRLVDDFEDDKGRAVSSAALVPAVFVVPIEEESDNEPDSELDDEQEDNDSIRLSDVD